MQRHRHGLDWLVLKSREPLVTWLFFFLAACGGASTSLERTAERRVVLEPFALEPQQASNWCWAAAGQMVMEHWDAAVPQCKQVDDFLAATDGGVADCTCAACTENVDVSFRCNTTGETQFDAYNFAAEGTRKTKKLDFRELEEQLKDGPVLFVWEYHDGSDGEHMLTIYGYRLVDNERWLLIADPQRGGRPCAPFNGYWISYDEYRGGLLHELSYDIYGIRPKS